MRMKLYQLLVNRVPAIQRRYHALRQQKRGTAGKYYAWLALLGMNISALFCRRKWESLYCNPDEGKKLPIGQSESSLSQRESPREFAEKLAAYDVISFDVFDTLIFRPFSCPTDLFYAVGEKLGYLDFERIRREMEWRARQKAKEQRGNYEVTLAEIYDELEEQAGIPKEKGVQTEIEAERSLCFGNPYMLEVFRYLTEYGKKIICTSDMYLPSEVIRQMVEKSGFSGISQYFISCEYGVSKGDGRLYEAVKEELGSGLTYIHVGDHPQSDGKMAEKKGFAAVHYQNVNLAGMPYRAEDMSVITGSLYRGIVNTHIHNGLKVYSQEYELGFIYGGLFVLGYCQWIHEYVRTHQIDKILFLARDGDILSQVYEKLYPTEYGEGKTEYVYWSRLAATKMSARYFKYDYFRRFIDHKVNQGYTLKQIFTSMEIEDMLPEMCRELPGFMEQLLQSPKVFGKSEQMAADVRREAKVTDSSKLTGQNAWMIKEYLIAHWEQVLAHYEEQLKAGRLYYEKVLKGCRRVAAVDVGWAGSGAIALDYVVNQEWHLDCEIIGLLAGTNTLHNAEPNMSEPQLQSGKLVSYLYSQGHNRDLWKWHDAAKGHNLLWEILLSSQQPSFKGFKEKNGQVTLSLGQREICQQEIGDIQQGILDFVQSWCRQKNFAQDTIITGRDVYGPTLILDNTRYKSIRHLLQLFEQKINIG